MRTQAESIDRATCGQGAVAPALATLNLAHLKKITHDLGIWQHCSSAEPNARFGFSIDDEARGLIVAEGLSRRAIDYPFVKRLGRVCYGFLDRAARPDGLYHNFADERGFWLDSVGSEDSFGRALWSLAFALSTGASFAPGERVRRLLDRSMGPAKDLVYLRAKAFTLIGLARLPGYGDEIALKFARDLVHAYRGAKAGAWRWFEDRMTYCNARLPQALLMAATLFPHEEELAACGVDTLDFLLQAMRLAGKGAGYAPIGNDGWYRQGQKRPALFDQQPVDAGALVEACMVAFHATGEPRFRKAAHEALAWYHGENIHGLPIYNPLTGGVSDSLTRAGISVNQGAESVLSYFMAVFALDDE